MDHEVTAVVEFWGQDQLYICSQKSVLGKYVFDLTSTDLSKIRHNFKKESLSKNWSYQKISIAKICPKS